MPSRGRVPVRGSTASWSRKFVHAIEAGEQAGVFFDGVFSHGLRRTAAPGEFRINTQYGGRMDAVLIAPEIVEQMRTVLQLLPGSPLYCRVDGVVQGREFVLMEVEVNEPGLGLDLAQDSADRFADALLRRLNLSRRHLIDTSPAQP
jgi:glutathione synthase/RimK-type ligase-like ATP-grasp enzyme